MFDHFLYFGENGPPLIAHAPALAAHVYGMNVRSLMTLTAEEERKVHRVLGALFERWCFKTTINMVASGAMQDFRADWEPPLLLARCVVVGGALPDGCGMGMVTTIGEAVADRDGMQFQLLRQIDRRPEEAPELEGFLLSFRGLRLAGSSTRALTSLHTPRDFANPEQVLLRPQRFDFVGIKTEVTFDWTGQHRNDDSRDVVRARRQERL